MRGQLARPVRAGGTRKRAGRNPETAPRADPTTMWRSSMIGGAGWPGDGYRKGWTGSLVFMR
jgi:hypothetical protein